VRKKGFEPLTLSGLVPKTSAYTVPPLPQLTQSFIFKY